MHLAYAGRVLVNSCVLAAAMAINTVTTIMALFAIYCAVCEYLHCAGKQLRASSSDGN
jgi:hypothetical protein